MVRLSFVALSYVLVYWTVLLVFADLVFNDFDCLIIWVYLCGFLCDCFAFIVYRRCSLLLLCFLCDFCLLFWIFVI